MAFRSAAADFRETVAGFSDLIEKLDFFLLLRSEDGALSHWGLEHVHGPLAASDAVKRSFDGCYAETVRNTVKSLCFAVDGFFKRDTGWQRADFCRALTVLFEHPASHSRPKSKAERLHAKYLLAAVERVQTSRFAS